MIDIMVFSRPLIEAMEPHDVPHIFISINCPGEDPANIKVNEHTLGRLNLFFWDLDTHSAGQTQESCPLAQPSDGERVVDLVLAHPDAQRIVIHCAAGKSRSAAVAAALHLVLNGSDKPIFGNPRYRPNMLVYRHVLNAWHEKYKS